MVNDKIKATIVIDEKMQDNFAFCTSGNGTFLVCLDKGARTNRSGVKYEVNSDYYDKLVAQLLKGHPG